MTRLWAGQSGVRTQAEVRDFSLIQKVQISCEAHSASCSMVTGVLMPLGLSGRGVMLTTHLHVVPMLGMKGTLSLLLLCAFLA